jgi:hypothetical protein
MVDAVLDEIRAMSSRMDAGFHDVKNNMKILEDKIDKNCSHLNTKINKISKCVDERFDSLIKSYELTVSGFPNGK